MKLKSAPHYITVTLFALLFLFILVAQFVKADSEISQSERRPLKQKPNFSIDTFQDGSYFEDYEKYLLDQAILREAFRSIKATSSYYLLGKKDNNGLYLYKSSIYEILRHKPNSYKNAGDKIESLSQKFSDLNCYYAVIPDKNSLIAKESNRPSIDLLKMEEVLSGAISSAEYIDLKELLSIEAYYQSDLHWRQEKLLPIADRLLLEMGNTVSQYSYTKKTFDGFFGVYYGQSALSFKGEQLSCLQSPYFDNLTVYDLTLGNEIPLYDEQALNDIDPYSIFVGGSRSLIRISNPNVTNGKKLYLFRDSFASSLAPLLLCGYSEIVLIDLRYIDSRALDYFLAFEKGQDVLFLYSMHILNESAMLR